MTDATTGAKPDAASQHVPGRVKFLVCVDSRPQSRVAVRYACMRARNTSGRVSLLHVVAPPEFQHWAAVGDAMEDEGREAAEELLDALAHEVKEWAGVMPELIVREGDLGDEILSHVATDTDIDVLVIGAAAPDDEGFSLVMFLAGKLLGHLSVPLVVVPANLTDEQISNMT